MRLFLYKCLIVFIGIYILYNFTIGKKIDEYEKKMFQIGTDKGREEIRDLIRKEKTKSLALRPFRPTQVLANLRKPAGGKVC